MNASSNSSARSKATKKSPKLRKTPVNPAAPSAPRISPRASTPLAKLQLLARLCTVDAGPVVINGRKVPEFTASTARAYVQQIQEHAQDFLFSTTKELLARGYSANSILAMEHLMRWATGSDLATKDDTIAALKKCVGKTKLPLKLRDACKYHFGAGPREVTTAIRDAQFREYLDNGMGVDSIHQASGLSYEYICRYIYNLAKNNQMTRKEAVSLIGKYKPFKHEIAEIKAYMEKHGRAVTMVDMGVHFIDPILRS